MRDLDCTEALQKALIFIEQNNMGIAMTALTPFQGCNKTHQTCEFKGDDCAVQDLIDGFFENAGKESSSKEK